MKYQLLYFFSKGCFHKADLLFTHIFLYYAHLHNFRSTQGQNMIIQCHQKYFDLLQSIFTMELCNYRLLTASFVLVIVVFIKMTPFYTYFLIFCKSCHLLRHPGQDYKYLVPSNLFQIGSINSCNGFGQLQAIICFIF